MIPIDSIGIEITSRCNALCPMCTYSYSEYRHGRDMDVQTCLDIVKQGIDVDTKAITIQWLGEPTLHPRYTEIVVGIRKLIELSLRNILFYHYTNGSMLRNKEIRAAILDNIDELRISIDGATNEQMLQIRPGLDPELVEEGVKALWSEKLERDTQKPYISIRGTIFPFVDKKEHSNRWRKYCNRIILIPYVNLFNTEDVCLVKKPCINAVKHVEISVSGNVVMCCRDYKEEIVYGNIHDTSLKDIVYSEKADLIRQLHYTGKGNSIKRCAICTDPR